MLASFEPSPVLVAKHPPTKTPMQEPPAAADAAASATADGATAGDAVAAVSDEAPTSTATSATPATAAEDRRADANRAMFRVKLYELNADSSWDDKGTGYCEIVFVEMRDALCIVVKSEDDGRKLLETAVSHEDVYQRQQETLLAWTEPDGTDLALSFQDTRGCTEIFENIKEIQRRLNGGNILMNMKDDFDEEIMEQDKVELPDLNLNTLVEFDDKLGNYLRIYQLRDALVAYLQEHHIIEKLCELFETAEDMDMKDELIKIFSIMRSVVATNNATVFERVLKEDVIMQFCGIFEYDPEYRIPHGQHRQFLKEGTHFHEVVAVKDEQILQKIHQTFRAQFLKDVVLARVVEEAHYSILSSIVMFNQIEILNSLGRNEEFLKELFADLRVPDVSLSRKSLVLRFIQDFCVTAKSIQMVDRQIFYRSLAVEGIFQELIPYLRHPDRTLKIAAADILQSVQDYDTSLLRSFIVAQIEHDTRPFIEDLLALLVEEQDPGLQMQYNEMFKALFDAVPGSAIQEQKTENASRIDPAQASQDTEHFLQIFFTKYFTSLVQPISELDKYIKFVPNEEKVLQLNDRETNVVTFFMDILSFLSRTQIVRSKFPIASNDIIQKVGLLFYCKNDSIKIIAVKFLRGLIETKDDFYSRHIIKHDLLADFMFAFSKNGRKYNLFNSVCLSLLEYIRENNLRPLIMYLVDTHKKVLDAIDYVDTGKSLIKMYDTVDADMNRTDTTTTEPTGQRVWNAGDEREDAYFDEIEEEPSMTSENQEEEEEEPAFLKLRPKHEEDDDDAFERMTTGGKRLPGLSPNITVREKPSSPTPATPRKIVFNSSLRNQQSEPRTPPPSKGLVDYDDDPSPAGQAPGIDVSAMRNSASELLSSPARPFSPSSDPLDSLKQSHHPGSGTSPTPTKMQNLMMGAKRMALDSPSIGGTVGGSDETSSPVPATISPSLIMEPESPSTHRSNEQRAPGSHKKIRLKE